MIGRQGIVAVCVVLMVGAIGGSVRADSILTLNPPNGGAKEAVVWDPVITFTRSKSSTGSTESYGTFTIAANLSTYVSAPGLSSIVTPLSPTTLITGKIDVNTVTGQVTFTNASMNVEGTISGTSTQVNFNDSTAIAGPSGFAINLTGTAADPMAFMFDLGTSTYYGGPNEQYVVARLAPLGGATPFSVSNFFVASGSMAWTGYKLDLFAEPLPLPVPLALGTVLLGGFIGTRVIMKRRRPLMGR